MKKVKLGLYPELISVWKRILSSLDLFPHLSTERVGLDSIEKYRQMILWHRLHQRTKDTNNMPFGKHTQE